MCVPAPMPHLQRDSPPGGGFEHQVNGGRGQLPRQPVRYATQVVYDASPARFSGSQYPHSLYSDRSYDEQDDYYDGDMDYDDAEYAEYAEYQ